MATKVLDVLRIGIFYDGYYFYKVSNYYKYEHEKKARISINGLQEFIRNEVAVLTNMDVRRCQIIDAHYFKGRSLAKDMGDKVQSERVFEDILMRENVVTHYLPLRYGENNEAIEKGIDVWLALEAYELSIYKHFDILALIAGDGDYVPLVRKLHTVGTQVLLISWDFSYHNENGVIVETKTSRQLMEEVFHYVPMRQRIDQNNSEIIKSLFVSEKTYDKMPIAQIVTPFAPCAETEFVSTIFIINPNGFGFIKDEARNNIFFHYSQLTNCDFAELRTGMKVRCVIEEDIERTKRDGAERCRAVKVTVID
jgi:uncharacterized LabA/DUF88 family protein/cold shock CspA family protein